MPSAQLEVVRKQAKAAINDVGIPTAGAAVFTLFFERNPGLVEKFSGIKDAGKPYDGSNKMLRNHSEKVAKAIFDLIDAIDTAKEDELFKKQGGTHQKRGIDRAQFDSVRDCLVDVLEKHIRPFDRPAWVAVMDKISVGILKHM